MDDQWADPIGKMREHNKRRREAEAAQAEDDEYVSHYESLWKECISNPPSSLLELGAHIAKHRHEWWLDLYELIQRRWIHARRGDPQTPDHAKMCALRIIRAACAGMREKAESDLAEMTKEFHSNVFLNAFGNIKNSFWGWEILSQFPHTPHMTTEELVMVVRDVESLRLSRPTIYRMKDDGRLVLDNPYGHLVRFRHIEPSIQRTMLRAVHGKFQYFFEHSPFVPVASKSRRRKR
jgi:hypothetical protein